MVVGDIASGTDVLVIGGGPGGYTCAIRAGQLGLDVTLVEKNDLGGVCLNRGCIPSKALVASSSLAFSAQNAQDRGVHAEVSIDMGSMIGWKDEIVTDLTSGVEKLCKANGVTLIDGRAEFSGPGSARVVHEGEGQGAESIEFEHAVIATGSRPIEIPGFAFDDEPVIDSAHALNLSVLPEELVVIGAGYIGMELSTVFQKLGVSVTIIEMLDSILPGYDADLARPVKKHAEELGVSFHFEQRASGWEQTTDGIVVLTENGDEFPAENVLVAVGRTPVTDTVNLDAIGLEPNENGFLDTDDHGQTTVDNVFAIGDVAGEPMLAHKGFAEGEVVAEVIAGEPSALDYQSIPKAVFTDPEIGQVGLTESEAAEAGFEPIVGRFPFRASGRALTTGHPDGFVRVIADGDSGIILGGAVVGPDASELIAELGLAVEMSATLLDVAKTVHTHPTLAESVSEAAKNALGQAIHTLNR